LELCSFSGAKPVTVVEAAVEQGRMDAREYTGVHEMKLARLFVRAFGADRPARFPLGGDATPARS
jgi:hypothetical protein